MNLTRRFFSAPDARACLLLAALPLVWFAPAAALQGVFFFGDATDYYARLSYGAARLLSGQLPLWNPYLSLGGSHAADPAAMPWYPIHLLLFLVLPDPAAYNYTVLLHIVIAGIGMFLLARAWKQSTTAALLAGTLYSLNGFMIAHLEHLNIVVGLAWMPWVLLCVQQFHATRRWWFIGLGSLALGLQILGGHTQIVLYSGLAVALYVLALWVRPARRRDWQQVRREAVAFVLLATGAAGLAGVFLIPFAELVGVTTRAGSLTFDYATSFSLVPERLATLILPFAFGGSAVRPESGSGSLIEMSAYAGILALALAPLGITQKNWRTVWLAGLAVLGLVLALGRYTPLYQLVFQIPLFRSVRAPARFLALVVFALAALAGFGLDALRAGPRRRLTLVIAGILLTGLVILVLELAPGLHVSLPSSLGRILLVTRDTYVALGLMLASAGLLVLWRQRIFGERVRLVLTVALTVLDLLFFSSNLAYNQVTSPKVYTTPSSTAQRVAADPDHARIYYWDRGGAKLASFLQQRDLKSYVALSRDGLRQSLPMNFALASLQGYGTEPPAYTDWVQAVEQRGTVDSLAERLIGLFGGRYLLTANTASIAGLSPVLRTGVVQLYENPQAQPRAALVPQARIVADQAEALATIQRPDFDPRAQVVLETGAPPLDSTQGFTSTVALRDLSPEHVSLQTNAERTGYLVLSDTFYPGWEARIDGTLTSIYRANALVRAVLVPSGEHTVEFVYNPLSVKIGGAVSGISLVLLLVFLAWAWYRRGDRQ